ncbi:MAG: hypothetical protein ABIP74_01110 [Candidatus Saccharimonas sp.]
MTRHEAAREWQQTYEYGAEMVQRALRSLGGESTSEILFATPPLDTLHYPEAAKEGAIDSGAVTLGRFGTTLVLVENAATR